MSSVSFAWRIMQTYTHTYRKLAQAEFEFALVKWSGAVVKGLMGAELEFLQRNMEKADQNLAETKLLAAISRNALVTEIEERNQPLMFLKSLYQKPLPVSGNSY
jgi:hypothetical protein